MTAHLTRRSFNLLGLSLGLSLGGGAARADEPRQVPPMPFLRGTNFGGMSYTPGQMWPVKPAVDYYISQKRMNVVRLCLLWELVQPQLNGEIDPEQKAGIEDQIDRITAAGAYVILELHNYGRRTMARFTGTLTAGSNEVTNVSSTAGIGVGQTFKTDIDGGFAPRVTHVSASSLTLDKTFAGTTTDGVGNRTEVIIGETGHVTGAHFADVWSKIALIRQGNPKIIFELMNEPHDQDSQILVDVSNLAIEAIRSTGALNLIMVSANGWNSFGWQAGSENHTHMLQIEDRGRNFCFDVHHYFDNWSTGQTLNVRENPIDSMKDFAAWAKTHGKRGFCGEFGCGGNRRGLDACRELLEFLEAEENRDVFVGWCWWGSGGCWQPDYIYLLDPFAFQYSPTNPDPQGSATWANAVDRPQMKLLQEYLPKDGTPFNGWLIEDQLSESVKGLYRRGDYSEADSRWSDSGPRKFDAVLNTWTAPQPQRDGGFAFPASGQYFTSSMPCDDRAESIYAMVDLKSVEAPRPRSILGATAQSPGGGRHFAISEAGNIDVDQSGAAFKGGEGAPKVAALAEMLVQASLALQDGGQAARKSVSVAAGSPLSSVSDVKSLGAGTSIIGAENQNGDNGLDGTLYDLAVFTAGLSDADNARVQARLYWDSGLAHLLPEAHPYRIRPPAKV